MHVHRLIALCTFFNIQRCNADGADLEKLLAENEEVVLELASNITKAYADRCRLSAADQCEYKNYEECISKLPNETCADGSTPSECSNCVVSDPSVSNVRVPKSVLLQPGGASTDVIQDICLSRIMDDFAANDARVYYGSIEGSFRIRPATISQTCNEYDPRARPWFVAASSGPKDVVIILDISGSMLGARFDRAVEALEQVINSLTVADYFAVVPFSSDTSKFSELNAGNFMQQATTSNKEKVLEGVRSLLIGGSTNFYSAFNTTFDLLARSRATEFTSGCRTAVLFLTDGEMTGTAYTVADVQALIASSNVNIGATIFTYSLGRDSDRTTPKEIACAAGGIYTYIPDGTDLRDAMGAYYLLYAYGLGNDKGFVSWVEPYTFPNGRQGTTVSKAVYDFSRSPPLFVGVVGADVYIEQLQAAAGPTGSYEEILDRLVQRSVASCPDFEISTRLLQALRLFTGGNESLCENSNVSGSFLEELTFRTCQGLTEIPYDHLWANQERKDAHACTAPTNASDDGDSQLSTGAIIGIALGIFAVCVVSVLFFKPCKKNKGNDTSRTVRVDVEVKHSLRLSL